MTVLVNPAAEENFPEDGNLKAMSTQALAAHLIAFATPYTTGCQRQVKMEPQRLVSTYRKS